MAEIHKHFRVVKRLLEDERVWSKLDFFDKIGILPFLNDPNVNTDEVFDIVFRIVKEFGDKEVLGERMVEEYNVSPDKIKELNAYHKVNVRIKIDDSERQLLIDQASIEIERLEVRRLELVQRKEI